jgi:hypothetical protein
MSNVKGLEFDHELTVSKNAALSLQYDPVKKKDDITKPNSL